MRRPPTPPPCLLPSPVKPLFTVAQGDRRHGNITLQFIPAPVTWETSRSQTKKEPQKKKNTEMGKGQSGEVQMMGGGQSCADTAYLTGTLFTVISSSNPQLTALPTLLVVVPVSCPYPLTNCTVLDGELIPVRSTVCQQVLQPRQLSLQHPVLLLEGHDRGHGSGCWETRGKN